MSRPASTRPRPAAPLGNDTVVLSGRPRFAGRARAVRWASWRARGALALLVLLLAGAAWFVLWGPVLVVRTVAVPGVPVATAAEVRSAAAVPIGEQLVRLDLSAVRRRVDAVRAVASARVSRSWPNTLTITVTLRTPVAVVRDSQGLLHLADATGTAYADVSLAPPGLPLVTADASDPAAVQAVVSVLAQIPARLRAEVTSASARTEDSVTLTVGRATVMWGSADRSALKAQVLQALAAKNPTARHFDVSAPDLPAVG